MANLASLVMEGAYSGTSQVSAAALSKYGHETGAALIAMESASALHEIFVAEFYVPNTCEIQAVIEGASCVEESSHAAVMEASLKGVFAKVRDFFIKLKDKVVALLENIKRYLSGLFGDGQNWVKKYEKELRALKNLDGYEVEIYDYISNLETFPSSITEKQAATIEAIKKMKNATTVTDDKSFDGKYDNFVKTIINHTCDADETAKELWSYVRGGADSESDKKTVSVKSELNTFIDAIKNSSKCLSDFDKAKKEVNKTYTDLIKEVDQCEKDVDNDKNEDPQYRAVRAKYLHNLSAYVSKCQTFVNNAMGAARTAIVERNGAYKKALTGAFAYDRKNKKKGGN